MKKLFVIICLSLCFALSAGALNVIEENFDLANAGDDPVSLDSLYGYFDWNNATRESACDIVTDGGNTVMRMSGYSELFTIDYIPAEYVFSVDIKPVKDNGMINIFVRGDMPGGLTKINPKNAGVNQAFYYYEWDWYAENGGRNGGSSVGGSGVGISLAKSGINIRVKKYAEDSLTITSSLFSVKTGDTIDLDAYNNVKIMDTGKEIRIYLNGSLAAYIELSDESVKYDSDGTNFEYYKKATVYSADGVKSGEVENTRLHYKGSQLAVAGRNETFYVDNIKIAYGEHAIEYSNGEYTPETTPDTTKADTTQPKTTEPDTKAPETDAITAEQTTAGTAKETEKSNEKDGVNKKALIIIIAVAADAVIIASLAALIPKKKK